MSRAKFVHLVGSSCSWDGIWCARVDAATYAMYEIAMWEDLDSTAVDTYGKYNVQSGTVDLTSEHVPSALRSCGFTIEAKTGNIVQEHDNAIVAEHGTLTYSYVVVQCLWTYGAKSVACDVSGNNLRKLVQEARGAL